MATLLVILAHPDDESFGPGGTLAKYAYHGTAVHYLCGTRGESGTVDVRHLNGYADVAELRTAELMCAAKTLRLAGVHFLGYRDSGMAGAVGNGAPGTLHAAPLDEVAERIAGFIEQLQPDAIITHDQYGGYGHPDHIKLHQATLRAYELRYGITWKLEPNGLWSVLGQNAPAPRLYFTVIPKRLLKLAVRIMPLFRLDPRRFGRNQDIDLVQIASWDVPITTRIDTRRYARIKQAASDCHASQQLPTARNRLVRFLFRRNQGFEYFARAYPPYRRGEKLETGLFGD
ncbi:MAG: PIG-L family deacetylase [Thermoflexales bacterium]|nr:PIG-L family deacetylase [Thermoflexales bacterium]MDW8351360.1 PIG-L family deacetylase [Anaerolineae bacterium]